jgi:DNA-binding transcriptional regulator GbsR (MarR family)
MEQTIPTDAELQFVEDVALYFERSAGMPRMTGRILGWLMICDPPEQSAGAMVTALGASKASVSTSTRMLLQAGLIELVAKPGHRRDFFRMSDEGIEHSIRKQMDTIPPFLALLQRGEALLAHESPERRHRVENAIHLYEWMDSDLRRLFEQYVDRRRQERGGS